MVQTLDKDNLSEETFENGPLKCFKCQSNEKLMKKTMMFNCPPVLMFQIQRIVVKFCCFYFNFYVKGYLRSHFNFQFFLKYFLFSQVPSVFKNLNGYVFQFNTINVFIHLNQETGNGLFKRTDPVEFSFDLKVVGSEDEKRIEVKFSSIYVFVGLDLFMVVWDTYIL